MLKVTVLEINGDKVRLGFEAADDIPIHRWEVWHQIHSGMRPKDQRTGPAPPVA
jgi:carbon storage regulator CsrA